MILISVRECATLNSINHKPSFLCIDPSSNDSDNHSAQERMPNDDPAYAATFFGGPFL